MKKEGDSTLSALCRLIWSVDALFVAYYYNFLHLLQLTFFGRACYAQSVDKGVEKCSVFFCLPSYPGGGGL